MVGEEVCDQKRYVIMVGEEVCDHGGRRGDHGGRRGM